MIDQRLTSKIKNLNLTIRQIRVKVCMAEIFKYLQRTKHAVLQTTDGLKAGRWQHHCLTPTSSLGRGSLCQGYCRGDCGAGGQRDSVDAPQHQFQVSLLQAVFLPARLPSPPARSPTPQRLRLLSLGAHLRLLLYSSWHPTYSKALLNNTEQETADWEGCSCQRTERCQVRTAEMQPGFGANKGTGTLQAAGYSDRHGHNRRKLSLSNTAGSHN